MLCIGEYNGETVSLSQVATNIRCNEHPISLVLRYNFGGAYEP
jgi:hypothetical protein